MLNYPTIFELVSDNFFDFVENYLRLGFVIVVFLVLS